MEDSGPFILQVNIIAADDVATEGARPSATVLLTHCSRIVRPQQWKGKFISCDIMLRQIIPHTKYTWHNFLISYSLDPALHYHTVH